MKNAPRAEAVRNRWRQSAHSRALARKAAKKALAIFAEAPRCGAKTRTGGICQNPGIGTGGRCRLHGGATPSGDNRHTPKWSTNSAKFHEKVKALEIRAAKRKARLASMTPGERARYDHWCKTHQPGSQGRRDAIRAERRQTEDAMTLMARPRRVEPDPEADAIAEALRLLRRKVALHERIERERRFSVELFS